MDIATWLTELGLGRYAKAFQDNEVDQEVLKVLTDADLRELGVGALGHRKKLLAAIAALHDGGAAPPSPQPVTAPQATPAAPAGHEVERRHLTVMFVDLADSTALSAALDPEDLMPALRHYQDQATAVVREAGGYIAKYMGDGILAYFGYPQAREDAAERAVHAALGVVRSVRAMPPVQTRRLGVRVGIATGPVVVGDIVGEDLAREINVVGETPNIAARLLTLAPVDSVVIGETTHRLVGRLFRYRDLGPQSLKGVPEPVPAYLVLDERPVLSRFEAVRTGRAAFVGRGQEVALLLDRWEQAATGEGQLVLLSGEPGLGKSRLCDTFYRRMAEQAHVRVQYQCSPQHANSPLYPVAAQLTNAARFEAHDAPAAKRDKLARLLASSGASGQDIRLIARLLGIEVEAGDDDANLTPAQRREHILTVLVGQFEAMTRQRPVLVFVEDAHWIDPTTEELISRVVARAPRLRAMVLVTCRPEYKTPWADDPIATQLALNRLARSQVVAMVNALAGGRMLPEAVLEHIVVRTDGVPLFIEEMFQGLKESGLLVEEANSYRLTRALEAQAVPATLQDSLMARLDRLAPAKTVAQNGAVIGRNFSYSLLAAVSALDETGLRKALDDLVGAGLVFVRGEPPDANYSFKHVLIQDAAYNSLLRTQRQTAHNRIGVALEEARASGSTPELLAHHFEQAGEIGKALRYREQAGDQAAASSAGREAIVHYHAAVSLAKASADDDTHAATLVELLMKLGNALMQTEGFNSREAFDVYQEARAIARRMENDHLYLRACLEIIPLFFGACRYRESLEVLASIDETQIGAADHVIRVRYGLMRAITEYFLGHFESAWSVLDRVRRLDDAEPCTHKNPALGADPAIVVRIYLSYASAIMGKLDCLEQLADEAMAIARARGHDFSVACAFSIVATTRRGAHQRFPQASTELIEISRRNGFHSMLGYGLWLRGSSLLRSGQEREGIDEIRSGLALWRQGSGTFGLTAFLAMIANGLVQAGRLDLVDEFVTEGESIAARTDEKCAEADLTRLRARIVAAMDPQAARTLLERAIAIARRQSARLFELRAARDLARLLVAEGRRQEARAILQSVYDRFTEGFDTPELKRAKALLDELATA